jgi:hypothetical protein
VTSRRAGVRRSPCAYRRTVSRVTDLEGVLLFAGIPLAVAALIFALVFLTNEKPSREPLVKPVMDDKPKDSADRT